MRYGDILNILESRARQARIQVDATELELAMYFQLQKLVDTYDLDAFTVDNPVMAVTATGVESYSLPDEFGRMLHPHDSRARNIESGFRLRVSSSVINDLTYSRPQSFSIKDRSTTGTPDTFTIIGRELLLNPPPNSNSDSHYQIQGTYIVNVGMPDLDDQVLIDESSFLVTAALYQIAADNQETRVATIQLLASEYQQQLSAIVNGQARRRQALYRSTEQAGRSYR